jgi:hypothetical protein
MEGLMMRSRTSWLPKLRPAQEPKLVKNPRGKGRMLVPTPLLVAEEVRRVHKGHLLTPRELRDRLAARAGAEVTCPLTTGIFLSIIAGAAEEQLGAGKRPVAPYWRVVGEDGRLNPKWPPGPAKQAERLRAEGHRIAPGGAGGAWRIRRAEKETPR